MIYEWTLQPDMASISASFCKLGIHTFEEAMLYVAHLPYGRLAHRGDYKAVLEQGQGTCSLKHALLYELAKAHHWPCQLWMGIFMMGSETSKNLVPILKQAGLVAIPEAHCYLTCDGSRLDATTHPIKALDAEMFLSECCIETDDIVERKVQFHQDFIKQWSLDKPQTFEELWSVREACIRALRYT